MTRYLIANLLGLLLVIAGATGVVVAIHQLLGGPGLLAATSAAAVLVGYRLATSEPAYEVTEL